MTFFDFLIIYENIPEPDETYIAITHFSNASPTAEITLCVRNSQMGANASIKFRVEITGLEEYKIVQMDSSFINLKNDHPILWRFNNTRGGLYFSGKVSNAKAVVADLYAVNNRIFGGLVPMESYFNCGINVLKVLGSHSGLVASGPVNILDCYSDVLVKHDVTHSIIEGHNPGYKNGIKLPGKQVLLIGDCYFVGNEFDFFRID